MDYGHPKAVLGPDLNSFLIVGKHHGVPPCNPTMRFFSFVILALATLSGCTCYRVAAPVDGFRREEALVRTTSAAIVDDQDLPSLIQALGKSIEYYQKQPPSTQFNFGRDTFSAAELQASLAALRAYAETGPTSVDLHSYVNTNFTLYRTPLRSTLFTGYFAPVLEGSRERTPDYAYPLYRPPPEMLTIRLPDYFPGQRLTNLRETLKGFLRQGSTLVSPYYTRAEIDYGQALAGRGLELIWLRDPIDAFFLHIQGSGSVRLPDGGIVRMNYADKNGHPYRAIGKLLVDRGILTKATASMQSIKAHLRAHPADVQEILSYNPSYVFFQESSSPPVGSTGVELTPHRSIATDHALFPKGALAFIGTEIPATDGKTVQTKRLVLNQDTGGAIRGVDRVDLFVGAGAEAEVQAGHLKHRGTLYFLAPRRELELERGER